MRNCKECISKNNFLPSFSSAVQAVCAVAALFCVLLRPQVAAQGVLRGLSLCYQSIIPGLFPFLVLLRLVLAGRTGDYLGVPLLPYTRALGIRPPKAATALLFGLTGGFCTGAKAVQTLYEQKQLTARQASLMLCCTVNSGLGFIVGGVGTAMLHSASTGWLLLGSHLAATLVSALLCRVVLFRGKLPAAPALQPAETGSSKKKEILVVSAIQDAVNATLMLCGFVIAFAFLTAILSPANGAPMVLYRIALPLEVTSACAAAAQSGTVYRAYLCCVALSCMGLSVFAQVRALTDSAISLIPLLVSRLFHVPVALLVFAGLLRLFTGALAASTQYTAAVRMPFGALTSVFFLCATFFCIFPVRQKSKEATAAKG